MRRIGACLLAAACLAPPLLLAGAGPLGAVEVVQLTESNWDELAPAGKEVDCIYGDLVLRNDHVVVVIAEAIPTRNANMTVRNVGGAVIDLTARQRQSDQLSAYYPLGARYQLAAAAPTKHPASKTKASADAVELTFQGPANDGRSNAQVTYALSDDARWLKIVTRVENTSDEPLELELGDAIRADGEFQFGRDDALRLFWAYDAYWRQAYGTVTPEGPWRIVAENTSGRKARPVLRLENTDGPPKLAPGESVEIVRYLVPAADTIELAALVRELRGEKLVDVALDVRDPDGPVESADVEVEHDGEVYGHGRTDEKGRLLARLPAGDYQARVSAQGRGEQTLDWGLSADRQEQVELPSPAYVVAGVTDDAGKPIACKIQFRGAAGTPDPDFGPDSAIHGVGNLHYTHDGTGRVPLAPGTYDVIISHGPEYDAVFRTIDVQGGQETPLEAKLARSVDTSGWISADFHSHSTPSGDNTSSQRGRVLNLLAEHIEFAPCTEHNRLTVYDEHLEHFGAQRQMLTCPGIELTGIPGSVNHQNAFPMKPQPRTQDGGAPTADVDPVVQIERLAMWHDASDKLVQTNHPNIMQIIGDRDTDGSPDGGFERMFSLMDVIEVHPLFPIFYTPDSLPEQRKRNYSVFNWLQLHNLGYRLPGVVNTDAHWNFHGSGFLRNYVKSPTDDPAEARVMDLVHTCEHGRIVMTNGPFLEIAATADETSKTADVGDDLAAPGGKLHLRLRVQCPNWLEVNRVQVFVNGRPEPAYNFTRQSHPELFHQDTVAFAHDLPVELESDAHLIVACAGEGKELGDVMGPDHGKDMPAAVGNPIFVDVDGDGFEPNGDLLGLSVPLEPGFKPSKPHHHHHDH